MGGCMVHTRWCHSLLSAQVRNMPRMSNCLTCNARCRDGAGMKENIPAILFHNTVQTGVRAGKILWVRRIFVQISPNFPGKFLCGELSHNKTWKTSFGWSQFCKNQTFLGRIYFSIRGKSTAEAILTLGKPDWLNWSNDKDNMLGLTHGFCRMT